MSLSAHDVFFCISCGRSTPISSLGVEDAVEFCSISGQLLALSAGTTFIILSVNESELSIKGTEQLVSMDYNMPT